MSDSERRDAVPLIVLAAAIAIGIVALNASGWVHSLLAFAGRPATVSFVVALLILAFSAFAARLVFTRRALARRSAVLIVPADSFDPSEDAVVAFASALGRSRRAISGFFDSPASAVRVRLDADETGRLRYAIELPEHARAALRVGLAAYDGVELLPGPVEAAKDEDAVELARAELVLARSSSEPLRGAGLDPDPLSGFARALEALDVAGRDHASVCVDLLPAGPGGRRRLHRRLLREARRGSHSVSSPGEALADLIADGGRKRNAPTAAETTEQRLRRHALGAKLGAGEPLFELQVLVCLSSPIPGRAKAQLGAILAAFDTFAGENHLRVSGLRVPGIAFLGSDLPWRRGRFDRRFATGLFRPARRRIVNATEIAGLLKPPTRRCSAANVLRAGAAASPPPALPTFDRQAGLLPLGKVTGESGERIVGVPLHGTYFSYMAGRSRFGKTETAIGQFLHLARSGHGCLFLDPHHDGIARVKSYLTEQALRERVVEIDLTDEEGQPAWNLLAAAGRSGARAAGQVDAVVDSFASALGWSEVNARALNLTTQATQALCDLALALPAEQAPTIFEIPVLLANEGWRRAVLPHVSPPVRRFFEERFSLLSPEAITPVTNLIDRLRASRSAAALLGNPAATYDVRAAMDRGLIVLACPGSGSTRDRLIANFLIFDALHAAHSRRDTPAERRREFYLFLDEVQVYDGASAGTLAALLEQSAKFGLRAVLMNQNPERLTPATRDAILTNRSHLVTTALDGRGAELVSRALGSGVTAEAIAQLPRYRSLASVTLDGEISRPFRLTGVPVEELFPDARHPEGVPALDAAIAEATGRAPVAETLAAIDRHPEEIAAHLQGGDERSGPKHPGGTKTVLEGGGG